MEAGKNNCNSRLKIGVPDPKLLTGNLPCLVLRKVRIHLKSPICSSNDRDLQSSTKLPQLLGRNKLGHLSLKRVVFFPLLVIFLFPAPCVVKTCYHPSSHSSNVPWKSWQVQWVYLGYKTFRIIHHLSLGFGISFFFHLKLSFGVLVAKSGKL